MQYNKAPLSIEDQVERLTQRGLSCSNPDRLKHYLGHIGYYRLSAYWLPFEQQPSDPDTRNHHFLAGTTFDMVIDLYDFDRKLRLLIMDAIERIEVAVRTHWASALALKYGSHAHMEPSLFKDPWQHTKDLAKVSRQLEHSSEAFVLHYRERYSDPFMPPIWAVVETMTLGTLSRWVSNTSDTEVKKQLMKKMGLPTVEILEKVLHTFTPMRNVSAHHSRLWNRQFAMALPEIKRLRTRTIPNNTPNNYAHCMFNYLVITEYLKSVINPKGSWKMRLVELLNTVDASKLQSMGFPEDWRERQPWQEVSA